MREHVFTAAAWAPWADLDVLAQGSTSFVEAEKDWVRARDRAATAWAQQRGHEDQSPLILRVPSHADQYRRGRDALGEFAQHAAVVTNRGRGAGSGTTFVPNAFAQELEGGMNSADGHGIVVTEHPALPLIGWAMHLGALNLRTAKPTEDARTDEQRKLIDLLISSLYNGWTSEPGKWMAPKYLSDLAHEGMTWTVLVGSVLATSPQRYDEHAIKKYAPRPWLEEMERRRAVYGRPH